jgi:CrcB protein
VRNVGAVFLGGVIGTALRFLLSTSIPHSATVATFLINIVGSFVLGLLVSSLWAKTSTPLWLKAGLGTGLLGGFTTFSAVAIDAAQTLPLIGTASTGWAIGMVAFFVAEILLGILAAWAGLALGARRARGLRVPRGPRVRSVVASRSVITDDGGDL